MTHTKMFNHRVHCRHIPEAYDIPTFVYIYRRFFLFWAYICAWCSKNTRKMANKNGFFTHTRTYQLFSFSNFGFFSVSIFKCVFCTELRFVLFLHRKTTNLGEIFCNFGRCSTGDFTMVDSEYLAFSYSLYGGFMCG